MPKLIYTLNAILLLLIAYFEYNSGSDKTIIISSLAFVVILIFNLMFGLFAQLDKKPIYRHFYYSVLGLLVGAIVLLSIWVSVDTNA